MMGREGEQKVNRVSKGLRRIKEDERRLDKGIKG
jgi:hypothetical protein